MRLLDHPNTVSLKHCFFSTTEKDELYLNLVLEFVPETVHRVIKHYYKMNQRLPLIYVKLYFYQVYIATEHDFVQLRHYIFRYNFFFLLIFRYVDPFIIFTTALEFVTGTSNPKIYW